MHQVTGEPISNAHVMVSGSERGDVTNKQGLFELSIDGPGTTLIVTHIGFETRYITLNAADLSGSIQIRLTPADVVDSGELMVTAGRLNMQYSGIYSELRTRPVEDHLSAISGLDMVSRANFAKDPVIRGMRDGRVNVLIDGMRMTPACVDGMDPVTAYVETDNLSSIEIQRGSSSGLGSVGAPGGSVNFATTRPKLNSGVTGGVEAGFHSVSSQQIYQASVSLGEEKWAARVAGTYRNAGDLLTGNNNRIANSGLEKGNVHGGLLYQPNTNHSLTLQYIGDFAGFIGYPALLMDTRSADAHIAGVEHSWRIPGSGIDAIKSRLYINRVDHLMDDYGRIVTERDVMADMFMPMRGKTTTAGFTSELDASTEDHLFNLNLELYRVDAFGDMLMEHVNPDVSDMYLLTLGDVSMKHGSLAGNVTRFQGDNWIFGLNASLEVADAGLGDSRAISSFRAEYPDLDNIETSDWAYNLGLSAELRLSSTLQTGIQISDGYRLPDHIERYGYYIYQPMDNFFYFGNPGLRKERTSQAELFIMAQRPDQALSGNLSIWINRLDDYVAGSLIDDTFKRYENMGIALMSGIELDLNYNPSGRWAAGSSLSYVHGTHRELDDPLPMMPPLKGSLFVQRHMAGVEFETRLRWAATQNRISEVNSVETKTDGYAIADLFAAGKFTDQINWQVGVENILNHFYVDHLSVNSMPAPGRNISVSLRYSF